MADQPTLDLDALEAALRASLGFAGYCIGDRTFTRDDALALIARLRAAEAVGAQRLDAIREFIAEANAAREAHAKALAHALRPLDYDEARPFGSDWRAVDELLATRLAAAKETTT